MHDSRRVRLVLAAALIAAVALITIDFRDGGSSPLRHIGASVFGPAERVTSDVTSPVSSLFNWVTGGPSSHSKIAALQAANARLRAELSAEQLSRADEAQLSSLLQLAGRGGYKIVAASVIAAGQDYANSVTLDVGTRDGVHAQETVLNGDGLVGTVTQVSRDTSTVLLATDASAVVGARMAGTDQIGSVSGTGESLSGPYLLRLRLFDANAALHVGRAAGHLWLGAGPAVRARGADRPGQPGAGQRRLAHPDGAGQAVRELHLARCRRSGDRRTRPGPARLGTARRPEARPHRHGDGHAILRRAVPWRAVVARAGRVTCAGS